MYQAELLLEDQREGGPVKIFVKIWMDCRVWSTGKNRYFAYRYRMHALGIDFFEKLGVEQLNVDTTECWTMSGTLLLTCHILKLN